MYMYMYVQYTAPYQECACTRLSRLLHTSTCTCICIYKYECSIFTRTSAHQEHFGALEVHSSTDFTTCRSQYGVVWLREFHSGEQIGRDPLEQREIVGEELGQVHVCDGSQHEDVLIFVWVLELWRGKYALVAGRGENVSAASMGQ